MEVDPDGDSLEALLQELRAILSDRYPHLLDLFDTFAGEARFGRHWLAPNIEKLQRGACILEVGGGLMLLSSAYQRDGFMVTVLEPIGDGFSGFSELQGVILAYVAAHGVSPNVLKLKVEEMAIAAKFDLAYSVNVMEHVDDVPRALQNITAALMPSAVYRFTCPNYLFPYEPHFNIPTLFSKRLTRRVFETRIIGSPLVADPKGLWQSLNWISVPKIVHAVKRISGVSVSFDREIVSSALERATCDAQFAARRSVWIRKIAALLVSSRLHRVLAALPASLLPIIDCSISRSET